MAKQIFNTTEKSNFILNMTEDKYSKIASAAVISACFASSVFTLAPEITKNIALYSVSAAGLAISGVFCIIAAIISLVKKFISGKQVFSASAFAVMLVFGAVSLINGYDMTIGFYGFVGRSEGLLAILFYCSFFITGMSLKNQKSLIKTVYAVVGAGLLNSVFSLIQIFTGNFSQYRSVSLNDEYIYAASGLSQSPIFLAMVLSLSMTAAITAFILDDNKKRRIFCIISLCLMSFTTMFTYSLAGICGEILTVIMGFIAVFAGKAPKKRLASAAAVILPAAAAVALVFCGVVGNIGSYKLYDGDLLWWADSYMRISSSGYPSSSVDLDDTVDTYYYLNRRTLKIISQHPLTGTGPEQLIYPQLYTTNDVSGNEGKEISDIVTNNNGTFDKCYNEYLYTAATRGIPSLIALLAIIASVIITGGTNAKKNNSWAVTSLFCITVVGILIFLVGCSNITFSPIFWAAAGAACANFKKEEK